MLSVDNLSGARVAGRVIRVEHVDNYKRKRAEVRGLQRSRATPAPPHPPRSAVRRAQGTCSGGARGRGTLRAGQGCAERGALYICPKACQSGGAACAPTG